MRVQAAHQAAEAASMGSLHLASRLRQRDEALPRLLPLNSTSRSAWQRLVLQDGQEGPRVPLLDAEGLAQARVPGQTTGGQADTK